MAHAPEGVEFRPDRIWRVILYPLTAAAGLLALAGLVALPRDPSRAGLVLILGLNYVWIWGGLASAVLRVGPWGVLYRSYWRWHVPTTHIVGVSARSVPHYYSMRALVVIERDNGRPIKLFGLGFRDTPTNRQRAATMADQVRQALRLP